MRRAIRQAIPPILAKMVYDTSEARAITTMTDIPYSPIYSLPSKIHYVGLKISDITKEYVVANDENKLW